MLPPTSPRGVTSRRLPLPGPRGALGSAGTGPGCPSCAAPAAGCKCPALLVDSVILPRALNGGGGAAAGGTTSWEAARCFCLLFSEKTGPYAGHWMDTNRGKKGWRYVIFCELPFCNEMCRKCMRPPGIGRVGVRGRDWASSLSDQTLVPSGSHAAGRLSGLEPGRSPQLPRRRVRRMVHVMPPRDVS